MSCNTNNGTERINGDLKHDDLVEFKNCSLSELIEIVIGKFLPKLYRKYISLNVKFSSGYRSYSTGVPKYLTERPRSLVTHLLSKLQKVTIAMEQSVKEHDGSFEVESEEAGERDDKQKYVVSFGNENQTCSCTCRDFRRTRLLCKHFFAVIQSGKRSFEDLSPLFKDHPFTNLDSNLFDGTNADNNPGSGDNGDGGDCSDGGGTDDDDDDDQGMETQPNGDEPNSGAV